MLKAHRLKAVGLDLEMDSKRRCDCELKITRVPSEVQMGELFKLSSKVGCTEFRRLMS